MEEERAQSSNETTASQAQDKSESKSSETPMEETTNEKSVKTLEKEAEDGQNNNSEPPQEVSTVPEDVSIDQERQQSVPVIQIEGEEVGNENSSQNNDMNDQQKVRISLMCMTITCTATYMYNRV